MAIGAVHHVGLLRGAVAHGVADPTVSYFLGQLRISGLCPRPCVSYFCDACGLYIAGNTSPTIQL